VSRFKIENVEIKVAARERRAIGMMKLKWIKTGLRSEIRFGHKQRICRQEFTYIDFRSRSASHPRAIR
jgi:hypothetical protein